MVEIIMMDEVAGTGSGSAQPQRTVPRSIGYFLNLMGRLNRYIERENKKGRDIPRFTKAQIRMIFRFLARNSAFSIEMTNKPTAAQMRAFTGVVQEVNKNLPEGWEREMMD